MKSVLIQSFHYNCIFRLSAGVYSSNHMKKGLESASNLQLFRTGAPIFCDMQNVEFPPLPTEDFIEVGRADVISPSIDQVRKVATIVASELAFGQLSVVAKLRERPSHVQSIFRSRREGLSWLEIPGISEALPEDIELELTQQLAALEDTDDPNQSNLIKNHPVH